MLYGVTAELVPPTPAHPLDELQRVGVAHLLGRSLDERAGMRGPELGAVPLLRHHVGVGPDGAEVRLLVDTGHPDNARLAGSSLLDQLLAETGPLAGWSVRRCEVERDQSLPGRPPAGSDHDPTGQTVVTGSHLPVVDDGDDPATVLHRQAGRLRALPLTVFVPVRAGSAHPAPPAEDDALAPALPGRVHRLPVVPLHDDEGPVVDAHAVLCAGALVTAAGICVDLLFEDVRVLYGVESGCPLVAVPHELWVLPQLPPQYAHRYDRLFAQRFLVAATTVAARLTGPVWQPPACTAEELALSVMVAQAQALLESCGLSSWEESDPCFAAFRAHAFDNLDHELLRDARWDGFEHDPDFPLPDAGRLAFERWFQPFAERGRTGHPFYFHPSQG